MNKHVALGALALLVVIIGGVFIGAAAWVAQGESTGTGDVFGIGVLIPLGIISILFGLGTGLASTVTYLVHRD